MMQKDTCVPAGTIENVRLLVSHAAQRLPPLVDRPVRVRDGYLFKNANPALRTGLLSPGPCGTDFLSTNSDPDRDLLS
jgi:hypothetical protein